MSVLRTGVLVAVGVVVGRAVARKVGARRGRIERSAPAADHGADRSTEEPRWLVVTVNAPHDRVAEALPDLGPGVETRLTPASGDRGTEIAARIPHATAGVVSPLRSDDPYQDLRRTLREVKARVEAGEAVEPGAPGAGSARSTG